MEPLKIFDQFKLERLSKDWIKASWDNDLFMFDPIPDDYVLYLESQVQDMESLLRETAKVIKTWIQDNESREEPELSWQTLCGLEIDTQALLALLGYLITTGQKRERDEDARQCCLLATSMYLTLLTIPGANVYQIFHENLFQQSLDTLRLSELLCSKKGKGEEGLRDEEENSLSIGEKKVLIEALNIIMYDMIVLLDGFSLIDLPRSLEAAVAALIDVTKLVPDSTQSPKKSAASIASLNQNSYAALTALCRERHGTIETTVKLIVKNILTFMTHNCYNDLPARTLATVRDNTINYLGHLRANADEAAVENGISILISLIMMNCSKIAEDRRKEAGMIVKLTMLCRGEVRWEICRNLLRFSHNNKTNCRIFAQELLNKYLFEVFSDCRSSTERNVKKILLADVLCHCNDVSSLVRAKAISTISDYTKNPKNLFVDELFGERDDEDLPNVDDLDDAIEHVSEEISLLPDVNSMIFLVEERVEDERASVRISAIQILKNMVVINPRMLDYSIKIMSEHCRDATMTVRMSAIQSLTHILEEFPDYPGLHTIWVKSVVPQVFDVEIKVQIEALKALESLTIGKLSSSSSSSSSDDQVPWKILRELTRNKMRKHLAKSCDAWIQDDSLDTSTIRKIQSFINSEHNTEAWILLSAISESKPLPNMKQHFINYREFLKSDDFLEPIFEVLRSCWITFDEQFLETLCEDFVKYLHDFHVHSGLISIMLDIVYQVSNHLNKRREAGRTFDEEMRELMESAEVVIASMMNEPKNETVSVRAIYTLGHASLLCKKELDISALRILQGFLIDAEMIPEWISDRRRLQAATITVLGQQSMRSEAIAHEMMTIFAQILCSNGDVEDAALRVNAAKALADVCTRFTSLVEPYLPDMCISMKDNNPIVREAIVVIFIQLLVEDYIKVKGTFFFHILTMLADENETIREMTVFLIKERLLMKNKELMSQQFFECILHYNDFEQENKFCKRKMREKEKEALILPGEKNEEKRRLIYDFMLENLEIQGKFKIICTLITQVFNGFISGRIKVKKRGAACVLRDALYVVASEHLQVSGHSGRQVEEEEEGTASTNNSVNVVLERMKKHVLSVLLPTLMELRKKMKKSTLEADVGRTFVRVGMEFSKDQMAQVYAEFPEAEGEMERNVRLYGKKGGLDEEIEDAQEPLAKSTPSMKSPTHTLTNTRTPRIVLRRLSSLTYPGIASPNSSNNERINRTISTPVVLLSDCVRDINLINTPKSSRNVQRSKHRFK